MDEQFDKQLNNHIREVFDNFGDPTADASWLLLREKFPEKEKDRGIIWLWLGTAAAILLLALGIGIWVNFKKEDAVKFSYKPNKVQHSQTNQTNDAQQPVKKTDTLNDSDNSAIVGNTLPKNKSQLTVQKNQLVKSGNKNIRVKPTQYINPVGSQAANKTTIANNNPENPTIAANDKPIIADQPVKPAITAKDSSINKTEVATLPKPAAKPTNPFLEPIDHKQNETAKKAAIDKKVLFSVYAATYFNYAKGSSDNLNLGAGVTADIRLNEHLKLSTGLSIGQNSLNYTNGFPVEGLQQGNLAIMNTLVYGGGSPVANAYNISSNTSPGYINPSIQNYTAQLVALDVPVNLKYEFNPQKNSSYIAVGLSSGMFINESYTYQYNYAGTPAFASSASQTHSTTTDSGLGNFYFAKTLNVSFGVGYPLGKNHLIVEPFLKYPLEGLGEQQIRFGAGGINLKFDFTTPKK